MSVRQRRVRLLCSPLRVTEFGEGVTTAGGEWVCSQSASVSRQLSKVHQGCGAARPCGLTGVVWPRAWRAGDCGPPQNFGPSPGPEEIAAVHLAIGRAASEVRGRKASIRGVRQVACRSTAARPSPCMTSFCGCGGSSTMCARGVGWLDPSSIALLDSQSGPFAAKVLTALPTSPELRLEPASYRVMLLRRLRLQLPLVPAFCPCRRRLDALGGPTRASRRSGLP